MSDVKDSARTLMACAEELNGLSSGMLTVEKELAQIEVEMTVWVEDQQVAMWDRAQNEDGYKLPPEAVRLAIAHRTFEAEKYQRYLTLRAARNRAKQRITDLREIVAAHRSIVSAAKTELEATEGPQPAWSGSS
jgi:hypothetical protein